MNSCGKATGPDPDLCASPNLKCAFAWSIACSCVEREGRFVYRCPLFSYVVNPHARSPIPILLQALRLVISYSERASCTNTPTGPTTYGFSFYIIDILHITSTLIRESQHTSTHHGATERPELPPHGQERQRLVQFTEDEDSRHLYTTRFRTNVTE
jgi:hypothetical protein